MRINAFGTFLEGVEATGEADSDLVPSLIERVSRDPQIAAMLGAYEAVRQYVESPFNESPPSVTFATGGNLPPNAHVG